MMGFHSREVGERWALDKLKQITDLLGSLPTFILN